MFARTPLSVPASARSWSHSFRSRSMARREPYRRIIRFKWSVICPFVVPAHFFFVYGLRP